ncbi:MAG: phytoene desaturase family protein [Rhizobiaceae bacterium]|jgi:phytoene desaturase|nr:phytoene desaturase family protein [Rhizobiaceae bacterium]
MTYHAASSVPLATDPRPHAVIVGTGFGGLAAAVRLGARGYRVTMLEKLDRIGGRAARFVQDGFTFDAGPTIVTAPFVLEELWRLCGKRMADHVTLKELDPAYAIRFDDGTVFRASCKPEAMAREIARFNTADVANFERYIRESEKNFRLGFTEMVDKPYVTFPAMAAVLPKLGLRRADRSIVNLVKKYIADPRLQIALSFHPLFIGGNPLRTSGVMSLISYLEREYGVHYAMGGTHELVLGLADLVKGNGGRILTGTGVAEIVVEDGMAKGVRLDNGETIRADIVVSNADSANTHQKLVPAPHQGKWNAARVKRARHSMSLFLWYFGTNRRFDAVDHHSVLLGPRYDGLLTDIFDRKHLADDFSLYLHRPSASDPSVAPDGCNSFYVLAPVPNLDGTEQWTDPAMVESYRQKVEAFLERTVMPGLKQSVVTSKVLTPTYFRDDLQSHAGAAFSFEPHIFQLAWFRPHNRHDVVKNLFIAGAGTHPGAGLPGVISSAKVVDALVPDARTFAPAGR